MQAPKGDPDRPDFVEGRRIEPVEAVQREQYVEPVESERTSPIDAAFDRRDLLHWGPIWAGLIGTFATMIVLGIVGLAVGLAAFDPATPSDQIGSASAIWGAVVLALSFLVGGWIAGRTSSARSGTAGFLLGSMVFALGLVLAVFLTAVGAGGVLGSLMNVFGVLVASVFPGRAAEAVQTASVWTLVGLALGYAASVFGATLGTRSRFSDEDLYAR